DINNTAVPLSMMEAHKLVVKPALEDLIDKLKGMAEEWRDIPMLAKTHGQPASPTGITASPDFAGTPYPWIDRDLIFT
ncbi:MAG: hypothetical protein IIZ31_00835, partial [Lachnospiraceae bacterium]|nr:hypothetical protein [Lachnospiraceae bacterium]